MAFSPSICPLCRNEGESETHLFLHCEFSSKVWSFFQHSLSLHFVMMEKIENLFHQWGGEGIVKGGRGKLFIHTLLQGILWGLWKGRNKRIFEDKRSWWMVIDSIICEVASWVPVKDKFKSCNLNDMMRNWIACISDSMGRSSPLALEWTPPEVGNLRLILMELCLGARVQPVMDV